MEISLASRTETTSWIRYFWIFAYDEFVPIWSIFELPSCLSEDPARIHQICRSFINGPGGMLPVDGILKSQSAVDSYLEARRMIDVGRLYVSFGEIQVAYGDSAARCLLDLGELHFTKKIARTWNSWQTLFERVADLRITPCNAIGSEVTDVLLGSIARRNQEKESKLEELQRVLKPIHTRLVAQNESGNNRLVDLLRFIGDENQFDLRTGFDNYFAFDSLLDQICASNIWLDLNRSSDLETRSLFFDWSIQELTKIDNYYSGYVGFKSEFLKIGRSC
ncbi:MAG: hypothetical protein IPN69_13575 [Acidobacteria bacterium]|nr:hypothetical protein [Acidobacteriota bacterium]